MVKTEVNFKFELSQMVGHVSFPEVVFYIIERSYIERPDEATRMYCCRHVYEGSLSVNKTVFHEWELKELTDKETTI